MLHLIAGILFFLLSPGVLLTIPAGGRGLFASGQTSVLAAAVHATLFVVVAYLLTGLVTVEGFYLISGCKSCKTSSTCNGMLVKTGQSCDNGGWYTDGWFKPVYKRCGTCSAKDYYGKRICTDGTPPTCDSEGKD